VFLTVVGSGAGVLAVVLVVWVLLPALAASRLLAVVAAAIVPVSVAAVFYVMIRHDSKRKQEREAAHATAEERRLQEVLEERLEEKQLDWTGSESQQNKDLIRRLMKEVEKGNLDVIDELLAPDFVDHDLLPGREPDREGYKRGITEDLNAFSNVSITIEDQIAEGDKVMTRYTWRGTHDRGKFMGTAPTGKRFESLATVVHRISGGKVKEAWGMSAMGDVSIPETSDTLEEEADHSSLKVAIGLF